ncbi:alpha/beta hydrolase-fold protein [Ancylobacter sp. WKF20]|uniref:alpha/beta hydrolase n=1 Tax=Ancylobacter sp. WKF20 TaxID=3039801 RepID=UPI0024341749|nr:alpha/beta hydrolase-fold protein [Ancylobacter sp. WKF20]WGD28917.1 alpha/beta hydrolase-fold protein [Ancylobacter sp. WKF20]
MPAVIVPDAEWFDLAPPGSGAPWRIFLARPRGPAPSGGFPLIVMLDANAAFATFTEVMRRGAGRTQATGIEEAVLVGIGYPEDDDSRRRRTFDYTAGPSAEMREGLAPSRPTGGRDALLAFIESVLKPRLAADLLLDPRRHLLFGHSLGGWFTLDVALRDPAAFAAYVAVSPSLWWDEPRLREGLVARREAGTALRLAMMVGEWEEAMAPWQQGGPLSADMAARRAARGMVTRATAFAAAAAAELGPGADIRFTLLAGEDHASVLPTAMARALRFLRGG